MEDTKEQIFEQIFEKVQEIINERNDIDLHEIKSESNLTELGLDSLDIVELTIEIDKEFDISVSDSYIEDWITIENVVNDIMLLKQN